MDASTFVLKLRGIPSAEAYKKADYSNVLIEKLVKSHSAIRKNIAYKTNENPILELLDNYIVSDINVCFSSFYDSYEVELPFIHFGSFDADILALNTQNEEVVLLDSQSERTHIMCSCAETSFKFLDILYEAASFNSKKAIDEKLEDDIILLEKVNELSSMAGGAKYQSFCNLLIGYYSN